jgi:sec-independent protein translocase protein TatA
MFDPSAPHIIILLVVVLLLFGSSRLPGAARSLGKSMHIFKNSVKGLDPDDPSAPSAADGSNGTYTQATVLAQPSAQLTPPQSNPAQQAQIDELQRQLNDLQRASAGNAPQDAPPTSQSN